MTASPIPRESARALLAELTALAREAPVTTRPELETLLSNCTARYPRTLIYAMLCEAIISQTRPDLTDDQVQHRPIR